MLDSASDIERHSRVDVVMIEPPGALARARGPFDCISTADLHTKVRDLVAAEFHDTLGVLGIAQHRVAKLFAVSLRSVRRWRHGDRRVPRGVAIVVRLLAAKAI